MLAEWFGRSRRLWSRRWLFVFRRGALCVGMKVTAISLGIGKFLHEGMEGCVDGFGDCLFGGGFDPVLLCFKVRFDLSDCGRRA